MKLGRGRGLLVVVWGFDIIRIFFFSSLIFLYYRTVATVLVLQYDGMSATVIDYKFYFI